MLIQTDRLDIFPLNYEQLVRYINNNKVLENELGLLCHPRNVPYDLYEAVTDGLLPNLAARPDRMPYYTLWIAVERAQKSLVCSFLFKGEPNKLGQVEIGYGSESGFEGKGYMTEALSGAIRWASEQKELRSIIAETNSRNLASIRVLKKNAFTMVSSREDLLVWKCRLKKQ